MNEKTKEILKEAGWYEGKKIDITDILEIYKKENIELSEKQKEFIEEFGDLIIRKNGNPYHKFNLKKLFKYGYEEYLSVIIGILVKEQVIPLGTMSGCMDTLYISKSGKFYTDYGYIGDDKYSVWNLIFQNDITEYKQKFKTWQEMGLYDKLCEMILKDAKGEPLE